MNISVIGMDYVGLVSAACFAEMGNQVRCVCASQRWIDDLQHGGLPIHEPGLEALVQNNSKAGRLHFSIDIDSAIATADILFICTDLHQLRTTQDQLHGVLSLADTIAANLTDYTLIVNKATLPIGSTETLRVRIQDGLDTRNQNVEFDVAANPEFLKEGSALEDFMRPDRIVLGVDSHRARQQLTHLYQSFSRHHDKLIFMGIEAAELTKYAANAMLAARISLMNEMASLAELAGVDIEEVRKGVGSDSRIGYSYLYPGIGYGGMCLPQDLHTLIDMALQQNFQPLMLQAIEARNQQQKVRIFEKIVQRFGPSLNGRTIAVWGLSFKPDSDAIHNSSAIDLVKQLLEAGANVRAYDPAAMPAAAVHFSAAVDAGRLLLCEHQYDAVSDADALVLATEWKPFRQPDFNAIKKLLKQSVIIDGRNQYDPDWLRTQGFDYAGIGREIK
ncbi:MAG: UDP-glucose/GDP-mannose dehydrogenase family protein [Bacterioplanes sp.]|nr:UDP-glucose/GDP-mannose dehydrogenase family protein [Bacterioplanes sp.]